MPLLFVLLAFFIACAAPVWGFEPRELQLMWEEEGPYPDGDWGENYCCIGDQNGDGCDDILYTTDRYFPDDRTPQTRWLYANNHVYLRFCGEEMGRFPDMRIGPYHDYESMGQTISYIGNLIGDGSNVFGISSWIFMDDYVLGDIAIKCYIYLGGESLDTIPDFTFSYFDSTRRTGINLVPSNDHPCDINGDGYDDLLMRYHGRDGYFLQVYYGGADFDTIPDFQLYHGGQHSSRYIFSGYDLNNDGCDDLLLHSGTTYRFYFGGSPPDTIPDLVFVNTHFANEQYNYNIDYISMVPDINGDGYDDWTIGLCFGGWNYGEAEWLFLGGDTLTLEPFRQLEPAEFPHGAGVAKGGDVNGDGLNDLVVTSRYFGVHDLRVYLGSPWVDEEPVYAISARREGIPSLANMWMTNNAHGDFNGDGVADFFLNAGGGYESEMNRKLAIYLGNPDWELGVVNDGAHQPPSKLSMVVAPNPFNDNFRLSFHLPHPTDVKIHIYDTSGRMIQKLTEAHYDTGDFVIPVSGLFTGIYFAVMTTSEARVVKKIICLK